MQIGPVAPVVPIHNVLLSHQSSYYTIPSQMQPPDQQASEAWAHKDVLVIRNCTKTKLIFGVLVDQIDFVMHSNSCQNLSTVKS